jgi:hypothetical protein
MKKFSMIYTGILALFIVVGVGMIIFSEKEGDSIQINEKQKKNTPGLDTMLEIQQIIENEQLEEYLLNIEVTRENKFDDVLIELQGNDLATEDTLLKDAYNIFLSASSIYQLSQIEMIWYAKQDNEPVLSMTLTKEAMQQLASISYADLPTIATQFERHKD